MSNTTTDAAPVRPPLVAMNHGAASPASPWRLTDTALAMLLALLGGLGLSLIVRSHGDALAMRSIGGRWFQSDGWRVFDDMVSLAASHHRNSVRPLFSLLSLPGTALLRQGFGLSAMEAIWAFNGLVLALWSAAIYATARLIGVGRGAAFGLAATSLSSAAALFWFTVPETYGLSSLALALALWLAAWAGARRTTTPPVLAQTASALMLAGTLVTSLAWVPLMAWAFQGLRAGARWAAIGVGLFVLAWGAQKLLLPGPAGLVTGTAKREMQFVLHKDQGGPLCALAGEVLSPLVMPPVWETSDQEPSGKRVSAQCSMPWHSTQPLAWVSALLWLAALTAGAEVLLRGGLRSPFDRFLAVAVCSQLGVHLLYGEETFLYALNFVPLWLALVARGLVGPRRRLVSGIVMALPLLLAAHNHAALTQSLIGPDDMASDVRFATRLAGPAQPQP
jgi:hypothetical protein